MKKILTPQSVTVLLFIAAFLVLSIFQILTPDKAVSFSERRPLKERPSVSLKVLSDGEFFDDYEAYLLDQAAFRETFRSIKAVTSQYLLFKRDNNGIYSYKNGLYEISTLNPYSVEMAGDKINTLVQKLDGLTCYFSFVPDKNSLIADSSGRPSIDLQELEGLLNDTVNGASYLPIAELLSVEDYYRTDLHWRQERILPIAAALLSGMNNNAVQYSYIEKVINGFRGVYHGQSALPISSETMSYLMCSAFSDLQITDLTTEEKLLLYDEEAFDSIDPYDLFAGGARSLVKITNPNAENKKTLYLFRDSFASSLVPFLTCAYSEIVLIDLRYIDSRSLDAFVDFKAESDVLFLYSAHILNESFMLR